MNNKVFLSVVMLPLLILFSCEEETLNSDRIPKLVQENLFYESTGSEIQGFITYSYDADDQLILKNQNDIIITEYKYDQQHRLIQEIFQRDNGFEVNKFFEYPNSLEKIEVRIGNEGDTLHLKEFKYSEEGDVINEKVYLYPSSFRANSKKLRLARNKTNTYYSNGVIQTTVEYQYHYKRDEQDNVIIRVTNFNIHGQKESYHVRTEEGIVVGHQEFINIYEDDLLVETYSATSKEYSYIRFEYDRKGRQIRTFDFNGYLTSKSFYSDNLLVEKHTYRPDGYDNIPDFKVITRYIYQ